MDQRSNTSLNIDHYYMPFHITRRLIINGKLTNRYDWPKLLQLHKSVLLSEQDVTMLDRPVEDHTQTDGPLLGKSREGPSPAA